MNKVFLKGNLTRDPQLSYTPNQTPVVEFGLAVNEKRKDSEKTHFFDCSMFGKRAEVINQYLHRGDPLLIEGKLDYQQWEKDGQKRSKIKVIVENFDFIGGRKQDDQPTPSTVDYGTDDDIPY